MASELTKIKGGIPEHYDLGLGPNLFQDHARDLARRIAAIQPKRVLELAAGTGILSRYLRDALDQSCRLTVTDIVGPMLNVAKEKFAENESVRFEVADAQSLPFDSHCFDAIACQFGVMLFPDKQAAYQEAFRVLSPGGHYLFNIWQSFQANPFAQITHDTLSGFFKSDPPLFWRMPFAYHAPEVVTQSLQEAGFIDIEIWPQIIQAQVEDYDRFAQGLVFGTPLVNEIRNRGCVEAEVVCSAIADALRAEFGAEPSSIQLKSLVVTGTRPV